MVRNLSTVRRHSIRKWTNIIGIVAVTKMRKIQQINRLVRKLAINVVISSVYPFFNEIKKIFLFFLKGGYNVYKA